MAAAIECMKLRSDNTSIAGRLASANGPSQFIIALNMIKKETKTKGSIKSKSLRAGWDDDYLLKVIAG
jgi:hypothetical protein